VTNGHLGMWLEEIIIFGEEIAHEAGKAGWKRVLEVPSFVRQSPPPTLKLVQHKPMAGLENISPKVTTREEDGRAKGAQCRKHVTHFGSVVERNLISGIPVKPKMARMDHLRFVRHHHRTW